MLLPEPIIAPRLVPLAPRRTRLTPLAFAIHLAVGAATFVGSSGQALAQSAGAAIQYDIPAGPLAEALNRFALQSGVAIVVDASKVQGLRAPGLKGSYGVEEGFGLLLRGSGYAVGRTAAGYVLVAAPVQQQEVPQRSTAEPVLPVVTVTASTEQLPGELPKAFAGGQVARGGRAGVLGNADILDTPFSITSFTNEFKQDLQAKSVSDVLRYSPSVQTPQLQASTQNDILFLRGFLTVGGSGSFDGLPGLLLRQPPIESIERIELLLGPNAFAYGQPSLSVGGLINLVPKRADDLPLTRLGLEFTGRSNVGPTVDIGRRFGTDNAWGLRVNGAYTDGELSVRGSEKRNAVGSLALDYRGDRLHWTFDHIDQQREQTIAGANGIVLAPNLIVPSAPEADRLQTPAQASFYDRRFRLSATRLDWKIVDDWAISAAYGKSRDDEKGLFLTPRVFNSVGDAVLAFPSNNATHVEQSSAELLLRGKLQTGPITHKLTFGTSRITQERFGASGTYTPPVVNTNIYNPIDSVSFARPAPPSLPAFKTSDSLARGVFLSDEIGFLSDRLLLTLGVRDTRIEQGSFDGSTGQRTAPANSASAVTPAVGVVFKVGPNFSVYANAVEALEAGAIAPSTAANAGQQFGPLKTDQIEAGAKIDLGKLAATVAVFRIERGSQYTDPLTNVFAQDGRQENKGIELSLFGELQRGLRLYSGLSVVEGKLKKTEGGTFDGKAAPDIPDYTLTAHLDWDVPGIQGLSLQGGLVRNGKQFFDNANTVVVPAWTRFDLGLRYATTVAGRKTVWRLKVENAADKNFFTGDRGGLTVASPRTLLLSATFDF